MENTLKAPIFKITAVYVPPSGHTEEKPSERGEAHGLDRRDASSPSDNN